jgi:hypothetical protein
VALLGGSGEIGGGDYMECVMGDAPLQGVSFLFLFLLNFLAVIS